MRLSAWLKEHELTQARFLVKSKDYGGDFSIHALSKWCSGARIPRPQEMKVIHKMTIGEVQPNDFYKINS